MPMKPCLNQKSAKSMTRWAELSPNTLNSQPSSCISTVTASSTSSRTQHITAGLPHHAWPGKQLFLSVQHNCGAQVVRRLLSAQALHEQLDPAQVNLNNSSDS